MRDLRIRSSSRGELPWPHQRPPRARHPTRLGSPLPVVIQGGMGVAVSSWRLASAVARTGQLGVVSGIALDAVLARRLQDGDPGGDVRRALAAFPVPEVAERVADPVLPPGRARPGHAVHAGAAAGPAADRDGAGAGRPRQLRRGVAGQGGPRRPGRA